MWHRDAVRDCDPSWRTGSKPVRASASFLTTNQDKVRKKLNSSDDEEHRLDVRAELLVAYLIVADRRFELAFEAYGARPLGPDLTVTFRANQRFNLEVTRLRTTDDAGLGCGQAGERRHRSSFANCQATPPMRW